MTEKEVVVNKPNLALSEIKEVTLEGSEITSKAPISSHYSTFLRIQQRQQHQKQTCPQHQRKLFHLLQNPGRGRQRR